MGTHITVLGVSLLTCVTSLKDKSDGILHFLPPKHSFTELNRFFLPPDNIIDRKISGNPIVRMQAAINDY